MAILKKLKDKAKSIGSSVVSTIKSVASDIKSSTKNLAASVIAATGRNALAQAPANKPKPIPANSLTKYDLKGKPVIYEGPALPTGQNNTALTPGQFSTNSSPAQSMTLRSAPTKPSSSKLSLPVAPAPINAAMINNDVGSMDFVSNSSNSSVGSGIMGSGTAGAGAATSGLETKTEQEIKSAKELEAEQAKLDADNAQKNADSYLKKIFREQEKTPERLEDRREDLEEQYQIQAKTAEINSLQESLSKMEVEVQNQVAVAQDKLGTNNFINNQVQQIFRNASPELNRLRADINFKTGILTQNEALIEKAMEQATSAARSKVENMKWFYENNYDRVVSKLDKRYDDALKAKIKEEEKELDYQERLWEWKRDAIIRYGLDGLTPNDSEAVITRAAARKEGSGGGGINSFTDIIQDAINQGATPEAAARAAAVVSETQGIQVDQKTLNSWTAEARKMKPQVQATPVATTPASAPTLSNQLGRDFAEVIKPVYQGPTDYIIKPIAGTIGGFFSGLFGK